MKCHRITWLTERSTSLITYTNISLFYFFNTTFTIYTSMTRRFGFDGLGSQFVKFKFFRWTFSRGKHFPTIWPGPWVAFYNTDCKNSYRSWGIFRFEHNLIDYKYWNVVVCVAAVTPEDAPQARRMCVTVKPTTLTLPPHAQPSVMESHHPQGPGEQLLHTLHPPVSNMYNLPQASDNNSASSLGRYGSWMEMLTSRDLYQQTQFNQPVGCL